jgi:predicted nucleic acid-binding protein
LQQVYVLDTNVVFDMLNQQAAVLAAHRRALHANAAFIMCPIVHFEVMRGFVHRPDAEDERAFADLTVRCRWEDLERADWNLASELWAEGQSRGRRPQDADVLIAAFARNRGAVVITADARAFDHLSVSTENWRSEE